MVHRSGRLGPPRHPASWDSWTGRGKTARVGSRHRGRPASVPCLCREGCREHRVGAPSRGALRAGRRLHADASPPEPGLPHAPSRCDVPRRGRLSHPEFLSEPLQRRLVLDGIVTLLLGLVIWRQWPASAMWAVGLIVGIDLLMTGWTHLMVSQALKRRSPTA